MGKIPPLLYDWLVLQPKNKKILVAVWVYSDGVVLPPKTWLQSQPDEYTKRKQLFLQKISLNKSRVIQLMKDDAIYVKDFPSAPFFLAKMTLLQMKSYSDPPIKTFRRVHQTLKNQLSNIIPSLKFDWWHNSGFWGKTPTGTPVKVVQIEPGRPSNDYLPAMTVRDPSAPISGTHKDNTDHATRVAGIIASTKSSFKGIAPEVDYRVANFACTSCTDQQLITNWNWAKDQGYGAIWNMSFTIQGTGGVAWPNLPLWIDYLVMHQYILPIAAIGNVINWESEPDCNAYPSICLVFNKLKNGLTVGGIDDKNSLSRLDDEFHIHSSWINAVPANNEEEYPHVAAVGHQVQSLCYDGINSGCNDPDNSSLGQTGTSFSTPQITGLAALVASLNYDVFQYWPEPVRAIILASAKWDTDGYNYWIPHTDAKDGAGVIDAKEACNIVSMGKYDPISLQGRYDYKVVDASDFPIIYEYVGLNPGMSVKVALVWDRNVTCTNPTPLSGCAGYAPKDDLDLWLECYQSGFWVPLVFSSSAESEWETLQYENATSNVQMCRIRVHKWSFSSSYTYMGIAWTTFF